MEIGHDSIRLSFWKLVDEESVWLKKQKSGQVACPLWRCQGRLDRGGHARVGSRRTVGMCQMGEAATQTRNLSLGVHQAGAIRWFGWVERRIHGKGLGYAAAGQGMVRAGQFLDWCNSEQILITLNH